MRMSVAETEPSRLPVTGEQSEGDSWPWPHLCSGHLPPLLSPPPLSYLPNTFPCPGPSPPDPFRAVQTWSEPQLPRPHTLPLPPQLLSSVSLDKLVNLSEVSVYLSAKVDRSYPMTGL